MNNNKKAPAGATNPARAAGQVVKTSPCGHCTTLGGGLSIMDFIFTGRQNAHTAAEFAVWLNTAPRDVTRMIERARLDGAPICATCNVERPGYYLAADAEELSEYLRRFKARRRTIARTEAALMATLCALTGQQRMELPVGGGDAT